MDTDPLIGAIPPPDRPSSRIDLLRRVEGLQSDLDAMRQEVISFCRENLQQGPSYPGVVGAILGRVQRRKALESSLAHPASSLGPIYAKALLDDLIDFVGTHDEKLAAQRSALTGQKLGQYQMWSYPPTDSSDPFRDIGSGRSEAVNTLGLGYFRDSDPSSELVRWAHSLPVTISAHQPTAWDAGTLIDNVYWRPGGFTWKLDDDVAGVPELVHEPVTGEYLNTAIESIL